MVTLPSVACWTPYVPTPQTSVPSFTAPGEELLNELPPSYNVQEGHALLLNDRHQHDTHRTEGVPPPNFPMARQNTISSISKIPFLGLTAYWIGLGLFAESTANQDLNLTHFGQGKQSFNCPGQQWRVTNVQGLVWRPAHTNALGTASGYRAASCCESVVWVRITWNNSGTLMVEVIFKIFHERVMVLKEPCPDFRHSEYLWQGLEIAVLK